MTRKLLRQLFLSHRSEVQAYLTRKLCDSELAADLTQETFLRYAERPLENAPVVQRNRSYLFRTARNLAVDHLRQQRRRPLDYIGGDTLSEMADERPGQERITEGRERLQMLLSILAELPARTQQVFILNRVQGMSYAEVAQALDISESSVQKHLAKGLQHVTKALRATERRQ